MRLEIVVELDGDAFSEDAASEIARITPDPIQAVLHSGCGFGVRVAVVDTNGNVCGFARVVVD